MQAKSFQVFHFPEEFTDFLKNRLLFSLFLSVAPLLASCSAETASESPFDGERAQEDLVSLLEIGPRVPGTAGSVAAQQFIRDGLTQAGIEVREFPFQALTPIGVVQMNTIVGVVKGTRPETIVLSNHYDSKYFPTFRFVGANDGGSTTAWMLEMARVLGGSREGFTIWLCFFDGEEAFVEWTDADSLYGSRDLVLKLKKSGELKHIRALINVDMIGDCALGVFRDPGAPAWLRNVITVSAKELGHADSFLPWGYLVLDDHIPFRRAGIDTINLIDFRYGGERAMHNRNWHTVHDTIDKVCADSLEIIGDVVYHALPRIENHLAGTMDE